MSILTFLGITDTALCCRVRWCLCFLPLITILFRYVFQYFSIVMGLLYFCFLLPSWKEDAHLLIDGDLKCYHWGSYFCSNGMYVVHYDTIHSDKSKVMILFYLCNVRNLLTFRITFLVIVIYFTLSYWNVITIISCLWLLFHSLLLINPFYPWEIMLEWPTSAEKYDYWLKTHFREKDL